MKKSLFVFMLTVFFSVSLFAQRTVTGTVTDADDGTPLIGATVTIKGTTTGAISDVNGNFSLQVPDGAVLTFSYVGYVTQDMEVGEQTVINIALKAGLKELEEVVVIGYGQRRRGDVTTSVATVQSEDIQKLAPISPEMALQGTVPGVRISSGGGSPYARNDIRIRGVNTWGSASPLIVIDGIPITEYGAGAEAIGTSSDALRNQDLRSPINIMTLVNPNDIESISVLKDASAAAIYGIRASNGVVLIETRQGQTGRTNVEFNARYGVKNIGTYDVLDVPDYVDLYTEAFANVGETANLPAVFNPDTSAYLGNMPFVDWQDAVRNKNAASRDYNIRVTGASENVNYYLSAGYTYEEGPTIATDLQRYSVASNINSKISDRIRAGINFRGTYQTDDATGLGVDQENTPFEYSRCPPWQPIYGDGPGGYQKVIADEARDDVLDATLLWGPASKHNALGNVYMHDSRFILYRALGKAYIEIEPLKDLTVRARLSGDWYYNRRNSFSDIDAYFFYINPSDPMSAAEPGMDDTEGGYGERHLRNYNLTKEIIINYHKVFGDHNIDLLLNGMDQRYGFEGASASSDEMHYAGEVYWLVAGQQQYTRGFTDKWESGLQGYMGRASYNYQQKYYADVTMRYDGSSKFATDNRWDLFPSFSLAWRISKENFMSNLSWLNDLKLRGGWGKLGNHEIASYGYISLAREMATASFGLDPAGRWLGMGYAYWGASFNKLPNADLTWEKTYTTNIGFDLVAFSALSATVEYFYKKTTDLLAQIEVPPSAGFVENPPDNFGTIVNSGVEVMASYRGTLGDFSYRIGGNITILKNEVKEIKDDVPFGGNSGRVEVGQPLFFLRGYKTDGILQSDQEVTDYLAAYTDENISSTLLAPGDYKFQDLRGNPDADNRFYSPDPDGLINTYDQVYLGKTIPGYYYGLNFSLGYKGIDLSAIFYGEGDVQRVCQIRSIMEAMSSQGANQLTTVLDRWTPTNKTNDFPRAAYNDPGQNNRDSDRWVEDAGFFRLSTIQLGYTLPQNVYDFLGFCERLRIWVGGSNLFTLSPYSGLDPSLNESDGTLPTPMIYNFGIDARF